MRRRPKLEAVIAEHLAVFFGGGVGDAAQSLVGALDDAGYDVIEKATRRRERRRQWEHEAIATNAERDAESARSWVQSRADEERRLRDRCTFLYETAIDHGIPAAALRGDVLREAVLREAVLRVPDDTAGGSLGPDSAGGPGEAVTPPA